MRNEGGRIKSLCSRKLRDEARQTFTDNAKGAWRAERITLRSKTVTELLLTFCSGGLILLVLVLVLIRSEGCPWVVGHHDEGLLVLAFASRT